MTRPVEQQQQAIEAQGAVLLAAGAGTGKTATLVQRCLDLVTRKSVGVDRLLVVTFTNAAAAEMKQRLREALGKAAAERPSDPILQQQLLLLEGAHISTIHSFCLELLRAHFADLGLAPGVAVLDDSVTAPLARELAMSVVQETIEGGPATRDLIEQYCGGRGERLASLILETHAFYVTQPRAAALLEEELTRLENVACWHERRARLTNHWLQTTGAALPLRVQRTLERLKTCRFYGGKTETAKRMGRIEALLPAFAEQWVAKLCRAKATDHVGLLREFADLGGKDVWVSNSGPARKCLEPLFDEAEQLQAWQVSADGDPVTNEWTLAQTPMRRLLELTREFSTRYAEAKRALAGLDFADLEQFALQLLLDDQGRPTPVATEWRARLDYVFVDECQDVNAVQNALIQALAREGASANLFMVGDVKQSIYRFRLAAPELFQAHARTWPERAHHQVLPLTDNFRSREGILAFANDLFGFLFPNLGPLKYGTEEQLKFALPDARRALSLAPGAGEGPTGTWADPDCRVELHVVSDAPTAGDDGASAEEGEDWGDLLSLERQAHVAAVRLRELKDHGHQVWDKDARVFRPLEWSDVGVLLRSVAGRAAAFVREFHAQGIPLVVEQGNFLDTLEAADLTALLRILDNPRQDIPLFAVLRSPLVGWTLERLLELSRLGGERGAWEKLGTAAQGQGVLAVTVRTFLADLHRWRRLALMTSLTAVLETVLAETQYEAYLFTLPDGPERVANVRRFLDLAQRYDPYLRQGLSRFLRFVDEQRATGRAIEPLPPRQAEAVQLMSVHKSKGLEFPVVVLAGIGANFSRTDASESVCFSRKWGLAPSVVDLEHKRRHDSLLLWQVKREEKLARRAEELRLFYVAITRARDTLLLVGDFAPDSLGWRERRDQPPELGVSQATSYAEWLSLWLGNGVDWSAARGEVAFPRAAPVARLRWQVHEGVSAAPSAPASPLAGTAPTAAWATPTEDRVTRVAPTQIARFDWRYPHLVATDTPAKASASALRRLDVPTDQEAAHLWRAPALSRPTGEGPGEGSGALSRLTGEGRGEGSGALPRPTGEGRGEGSGTLSRPTGEGWGEGPIPLSATEIGTAHHLFLQHLDLSQTTKEAGLAAERERLRGSGVLTANEAATLDLGAILTFWTTPLGEDIRQHAESVRRELAFTAAFAAQELGAFTNRFAGAPADEFVVVQGAVDLAVLLPTETWIVDFKTDHVTEAGLAERAREHERQLRLYAAALDRIRARPVTRCVLHFLALGRSWEVTAPARTC